MKLTRLDLDRYGPFTGARLDFRPDADLHIVYGPNEAGKSSALSAITDLLYGFEPRSPANFRHRYEDLKIGAEMQRANGGSLRFWRRKRLKNSLTDAEDAPLDDGLLEPLLSGISREVFLAAFGLDQGGLREGARQMLAAEGEVGESLFAAASGLKTLVSVRAGLESEADALFGARRSNKRAFYEAQERYDQARRALREQSLRADDVRALETEIEAGEARARALAEQLRQAGIRRARIDRVRRVAPLLARIGKAETALAAVEARPDLPDGFAAEIETALARAETGRETMARLAREVEDAERALAAISVDDDVLAAGEAITALNEERAALAKAMLDLPRREAEAREIADDLDDLARRLGQKDRAALSALSPDDLALERIRVLAERRREIEREAGESARAAERARETIEGLQRKMAAVRASADPSPLRQRLKAMQPALAEAGAIEEQEGELTRRRALQQERLARLSPAVKDEHKLWAWREPSEEEIGRAERSLAALENTAREQEAEVRRLREALAEADALLAEGGGRDGLIDDAMLARERAERDALFEAVVSEPSAAAARAYRKIVAAVDDLADRRLAQAEHLARREVARRTRDRDAAALARAEAGIAARLHESEQAWQAWQALFAPLGCTAEAPAAMRRFLVELARLREERQALRDLELKIERGQRRLAGERPGLEALAAEIGIAGASAQSLPSLVRLIEDGLAALELGAREARSLADQLEASRAELARAEKSREAAETARAATQSDWAAALAVLGLAPGASPQEAAKASELWIAVQGKLAQLGSLEHRIASILDDRTTFAQRAASLVDRLPSEASGEPAETALDLMAALTAARDAAIRRRTARESLDRYRDALAKAEAAERGHDEAVAGLAAKAGCETADLAALAADLTLRAGLERELAAARAELSGQGDGLEEAALRAEAAEIGVDEAAGESEAVQAELNGLIEADKQAALALGDLRRRREAIEREAGAAGAAQALEDARSDLARITRDYLVLKTASLLLEAGLERQLRSEQGPLIARAGGLFATITAGGFSGIATLYDEADRLRLAARRPDGGTTDISGLSEGTRDQLYLSLRLAHLEAMAARREVPPFVGDDLVMTFDEERVAAALQVLALKGSGLQKILFTHHRHVMEIARERLGPAVDIVTLDPQNPPES
ncbi:AAA family ATPase [Labrys sp. LIt4]|uniref:ATP-binding protein n=1 Tax=Labrys sp. LIt4 TaxID=2821355 RepID=UPI001ADF4FDE|nr:YhaN family protein [Labrys sp. LIt4]MBP0579607.1 AAA family ATPase [Labrys sp. LIt4]